MPRKTPLPENEIKIGGRLSAVRQMLLISKTAFALEIGISREKLYNYERGRSPLPWTIGAFVCNVFDVNPLWLAKGEGAPFLRHGFGEDRRPAERVLFSDAMEALDDEHKKYCRSAGTSKPRYTSSNSDLETFSHEMLREWMARLLPGEEQRRFLAELKIAGDKIIRQNAAKET